MKESTRLKKEQGLIAAAESVFSKMGFKNARMEVIANEAGITKVTLYSYFQSKDNLIMAITYKALLQLEKAYQDTLELHKNDSGLDLTLSVMTTFVEFCEQNYFYSEIMLEYFSLVRSTSMMQDEGKLTDAMKDSWYHNEVQKLHNYPFKVTVAAIKKGIADGSIHPLVDPMMATLNGWMVFLGYVKLLSASGDSATQIFDVNIQDMKRFNLKLLKSLLKGEFTYGKKA
jgi:AcrR family transcriptional regulator